MSKSSSLFRISDTKRLCQSIVKAGLVPARVRVLPVGTVEADIADGAKFVEGEENEWDDDLGTNG